MCIGKTADFMDGCMSDFATGGSTASVCGADCIFSAGTNGAAMPADRCKLYDSPEVMNENEGWMPSFSPIAAEPEDQGMYLGVEVDVKGMTLRHEDMILVADMSGDPMEKNAGGMGLHAAQALASFGLITYNACPAAAQAGYDTCEGYATDPSGVPGVPGAPAVGSCSAASMACLGSTAATDPATAGIVMMASGADFYMEEFPVLAIIKLVNFRKLMCKFTRTPTTD